MCVLLIVESLFSRAYLTLAGGWRDSDNRLVLGVNKATLQLRDTSGGGDGDDALEIDISIKTEIHGAVRKVALLAEHMDARPELRCFVFGAVLDTFFEFVLC
jgi:hypothetical protein